MPEPSDQVNPDATAPTPSEPEVVRTTIVGGRPPGKGRGIIVADDATPIPCPVAMDFRP